MSFSIIFSFSTIFKCCLFIFRIIFKCLPSFSLTLALRYAIVHHPKGLLCLINEITLPIMVIALCCTYFYSQNFKHKKIDYIHFKAARILPPTFIQFFYPIGTNIRLKVIYFLRVVLTDVRETVCNDCIN